MSIEAMKQALEALESIRRYGLDTLSGRVDGPDDRDWQRAGVNEMTKRARIGVESLRQAIAEAEKQEHGSPEDMYVGMHKHLNCPHCGGSGHIDDVAEKQEPVVEADLCVMVGYSKANGGYFVYEETTPQEFCAIKGPFTSRLEAEKAMRDTNEELIKPQPAQPNREPLTDEQKDIINFLLGASDIDDVWFGDKHPTEKGQFWWRNRLDKAFQGAYHNIKEPT